MIRKLLICPWFGPLPPWFKLWADNITRLSDHGFDVYVTQDKQDFNARAKRTLGIDDAIGDDGRKICDFRCAFGLLYPDETAGYDFWGHTDLDMVYGRVERWVTDEFLTSVDLHSNHHNYVSGPWSLYRNTPIINELFMLAEDWQGELANPRTTGWVETGYSDLVDDFHANRTLVRRYTNWQTRNLDSFASCRWQGDRLMEGSLEVAMLHFRRTKTYPESLL